MMQVGAGRLWTSPWPEPGLLCRWRGGACLSSGVICDGICGIAGRELVDVEQTEHDQFAEELFLAGQRVPAGPYRQVGARASSVWTAKTSCQPVSTALACYVLVREM
jgi:hypothetical protein